jgi:hypothetical protein
MIVETGKATADKPAGKDPYRRTVRDAKGASLHIGVKIRRAAASVNPCRIR